MIESEHLGDNMFMDKEVKFSLIGPVINQEQINLSIPEDFIGKQEFVRFYLRHNGGLFDHATYIYRDVFHEVARGDHNSLSIEGMFFIPRLPGEKLTSGIRNMLRVREVVAAGYRDFSGYKRFFEAHLPIAEDGSGNSHWMEIPSGRVKAVFWESFQDGPIEVAPTFFDYVSNIVSKRRTSPTSRD